MARRFIYPVSMRNPSGQKNLYRYKGKDRRGNTVEYEALVSSKKTNLHNTRAKFKINSRNMKKRSSGGSGG